MPSHTPSEKENPPLFNRGQVAPSSPANLTETQQQLARTIESSLHDGLRLDQIADNLGITVRALHFRLAQLGDEYHRIRSAWIDGLVSDALQRQDDAADEIDSASDALQIARTREKIKAAEARMRSVQWMAERRDRQRYGVQQSQNSVSDLNVVINIGSHDASTVVIEGTTNNPQE